MATLHDLLVTLAFLAFFRYDLTLNVIAGLLTITGYSVNDTIVIFDRVRENLRGMRRDNLAQIVNVAVNQTLGRTVITAGTTLLSVVALYLFGGEVLEGFAFTMLVGHHQRHVLDASSSPRRSPSSGRARKPLKGQVGGRDARKPGSLAGVVRRRRRAPPAVVSLAAAILLGIVQGLTEFLPVSSSAHLILGPRLLRVGRARRLRPGVRRGAAHRHARRHPGVLPARDCARWWRRSPRCSRPLPACLASRPGSPSAIVVGTVPVVVVGLLFNDFIEETLRTPGVAAWALAIGAAVMFAAERLGARIAARKTR